MQIDYPFHFDGRGRTAITNDSKHIRDLIEQILFTAPGERVNRPTFGCDIPHLIFSPNSDAQAAATQVLVQSSLQQWMGDLIEVEAVDVQNDDSTLSVLIQYTVRRTQEQRVDQFMRGGPSDALLMLR
jgi:phage baseplate assembly protein W